ncbi:uncharacterized protein B0T15DRAFT_106512 [Chaetomium strumarium]|uniref:Thioredoxin-like fold domain-containing protein n=1 Tax=Chaetomium strumarium TaxID=1170767 RepID=A0AAJ0GY80_9PEZI|nr:hypothetical protein B0T15DRAFT_106512 [Chaetomium strumarium]
MSPKPTAATPTLTLFRGFPQHDRYTPSPFINKLETRLRIGGIAYQVGVGSPFTAPRGKMPYIELQDADNVNSSTSPTPPTKLGDTALITRKLVEDGHLEDLNARLTPTQRAADLAVRALLEDKLYFFQGRERWVDNYHTMRDTVLASIPYPLRLVIGLLAYRKHARTLDGQGVLRFSKEEAAAMRLEIWESVNAMLVESRAHAANNKAGNTSGPFWVLGGESPTEADPVVFGFVAAALDCRMAPETEKIVRGFPVVVEYAKRIHDRYFSDFKCWRD